MNRPANAVALSLLSLALLAGGANAAEETATFQVQIQILESCTISDGALSFPATVRSNGPVNSTGTLTVNCSEGTPYSIGLSAGANAMAGATGAAPGERRMLSGETYLAYDLYQDIGRTTFWGDALAAQRSGTGTGADQAHTVFGRVPSANAPAGNYSDTVTARVVY